MSVLSGRMNLKGHIVPIKDPAWLYVPFAHIVVPTAPVVELNVRVTQAGDTRITQAGDTRITNP